MILILMMLSFVAIFFFPFGEVVSTIYRELEEDAVARRLVLSEAQSQAQVLNRIAWNNRTLLDLYLKEFKLRTEALRLVTLDSLTLSIESNIHFNSLDQRTKSEIESIQKSVIQMEKITKKFLEMNHYLKEKVKELNIGDAIEEVPVEAVSSWIMQHHQLNRLLNNPLANNSLFGPIVLHKERTQYVNEPSLIAHSFLFGGYLTMSRLIPHIRKRHHAVFVSRPLFQNSWKSSGIFLFKEQDNLYHPETFLRSGQKNDPWTTRIAHPFLSKKVHDEKISHFNRGLFNEIEWAKTSNLELSRLRVSLLYPHFVATVSEPSLRMGGQHGL